jgi:hypothetical protein
MAYRQGAVPEEVVALRVHMAQIETVRDELRVQTAKMLKGRKGYVMVSRSQLETLVARLDKFVGLVMHGKG